ncbi:MAG: DUF6268 family outer membrane beta-barrel protein [Planctomycetaceae bacterium]
MRAAICLTIMTLSSTALAQDVGAFAPGAWNESTTDVGTRSVLGEEPIRRFKKQAIQSVALSGGWLVGTDNDLNSQFFETSIGLGVPLGSLDNILGVTPSFRVDRIDAADGIDIPSELYEVGVQFFYRKAINDRWSFMGIVRPAIRSDFTTDDQAFRIFGLGLLTKDCIPDYLSVSFGAVFLDRADLPLLPAIGLTWTPRTDMRLDLRFPESRLSHRLQKNGSQSETWAYLSGGLGGNTWAVTRESGETDELSLRDIRLTIGLERILDGGGGWFAEAGYAFKRRLEYESGDEIEFSNGVLFQAGWSY